MPPQAQAGPLTGAVTREAVQALAPCLPCAAGAQHHGLLVGGDGPQASNCPCVLSDSTRAMFHVRVPHHPLSRPALSLAPSLTAAPGICLECEPRWEEGRAHVDAQAQPSGPPAQPWSLSVLLKHRPNLPWGLLQGGPGAPPRPCLLTPGPTHVLLRDRRQQDQGPSPSAPAGPLPWQAHPRLPASPTPSARPHPLSPLTLGLIRANQKIMSCLITD